MPNECYGALPGIYHAGALGVEVRGYPTASGFHHVLMIRDMFCAGTGCPLAFVATSGFEGSLTASVPKDFGKFKICVADAPDPEPEPGPGRGR